MAEYSRLNTTQKPFVRILSQQAESNWKTHPDFMVPVGIESGVSRLII